MKNFLKISKTIGLLPEFVQGAGGNTSVKIGSDLFVKASGYFLRDLKNNKGFVCSNYQQINKYLTTLKSYNSKLELAFNKLAEESLKANKNLNKPSIEIGLHSIIPSKYVLHTHSAYANIFNFAKNGERILKKLFPNSLFIPYKNPGLELGLALTQELKKTQALPNIIFLKSHGLITHSNNPKEVLQLTINVHKVIIKYLQNIGIKNKFKIINKPASLTNHLFPDSVVYSQIDFNKLHSSKKQVFYEICSMINFTKETMKLLGLKPVFLPKAKVKFLINMEQEKYRINKFKNI